MQGGYGGQQPQVVGMQLGAPQMDAMTAQIHADYMYERKCINCMLIVGLVCGGLGLLAMLGALIACIENSAWVALVIVFIAFCFKVVEWIIYYLMYGAVNTNDWEKMKKLMKLQFGMFLFAYILLLIGSFRDDSGKPGQVIGSFVGSGIVLAIWFWFLNLYIKNGSQLQEKNVIPQSPAPQV